MSSEAKLEPCPFCGGPGERQGMWLKEYAMCGGMCEAFHDSLVPAEKWNTRPLESALRAEVDALRKLSQNLQADLDWLNNEHETMKAENAALRARKETT